MTRCFVAGYPISHSRSPLIHGHWIERLGLDASYERIETAPEAIPVLLDRIRSGELTGGNFTVPLKEAVIPHLDSITADARAMGAVNTVWREGTMLTRQPWCWAQEAPPAPSSTACWREPQRQFGSPIAPQPEPWH
jgi:shikimate dehydrogenase